MNDLRARIAAIVDRDRALHEREHQESPVTDRNPLYAAADPPASGRVPWGKGPPGA